jgi:SAM-dependent methyltransferase
MLMGDYWDRRYAGEGKIWGDTPSVTALYACEFFRTEGVRCVLIPGIGYGRNARIFVEAGMSVEGVEISGEAVNILKNDLPGAICRQGSVLDTPFGGPYDAIYCFNVLHLFKSKDRLALVNKCRDALADGGLAFFTVFSELEPSFGKGRETEPGTFESKPGRPVHYFTGAGLRDLFNGFDILEQGLVEDPEDHGDEGPHTHILRYILARKPGK